MRVRIPPSAPETRMDCVNSFVEDVYCVDSGSRLTAELTAKAEIGTILGSVRVSRNHTRAGDAPCVRQGESGNG